MNIEQKEAINKDMSGYLISLKKLNF